MAVKTYLFGPLVSGSTTIAALPRDYVCDTWAERPTSALIVGSRCFVVEDGKVYRATNATTWEEMGGGSAAWGAVTGTLADQTDLQAALDAKGTSNFSGAYGDLSGIPSTFAPIIGAGGTQACAGNDARLSDARTPLAHNHDGVYEVSGAVAAHAGAADPHTGYQKESEKAQANGYASLGADGKVPAAQLPAPGGGSDPWTYLRLTVDFTTTSSTAVDITGLAFTPAANTRYEFVGRLMVRTATATVGPRPGVAWPTGMTDGTAFIQQTSSATANVFANGNINAAVLAPVGGLPNTTQSWPALIEGYAIAGASPSGNIRLQLASETNGTLVRVVAGSFLKYRTVP